MYEEQESINLLTCEREGKKVYAFKNEILRACKSAMKLNRKNNKHMIASNRLIFFLFKETHAHMLCKSSCVGWECYWGNERYTQSYGYIQFQILFTSEITKIIIFSSIIWMMMMESFCSFFLFLFNGILCVRICLGICIECVVMLSCWTIDIVPIITSEILLTVVKENKKLLTKQKTSQGACIELISSSLIIENLIDFQELFFLKISKQA